MQYQARGEFAGSLRKPNSASVLFQITTTTSVCNTAPSFHGTTADHVVCCHGNGGTRPCVWINIHIHTCLNYSGWREVYVHGLGAWYIQIVTSSPIPNEWSSTFNTCCILSCMMSIHVLYWMQGCTVKLIKDYSITVFLILHAIFTKLKLKVHALHMYCQLCFLKLEARGLVYTVSCGYLDCIPNLHAVHVSIECRTQSTYIM